jgi:hypothetical protein
MNTDHIPSWAKFESEHGPFSSEGVYSMIGQTLFRLQHFEGLLHLCAGVLIETANSDEGEVDATDEWWRLRRESLDGLARRLREVVRLESSFDVTFMRLVRRRNAFMHSLTRHTPFNPNVSSNWQQNTARFIWALNEDLVRVHDVFADYARSLVRENQQYE